MKNPALLAFILLITACKRAVPCAPDYITPGFVGFTVADLDTIIVRQYVKNSNFSQLIDSGIVVTDTGYLRARTIKDTTFVQLNRISGMEKYLFPDQDWQLYLPSANRTIFFTDIISPQTESTCFKCSCWNSIVSVVQNKQWSIPQLRSIPYTGGSFYITYILR